jgi:S1-C subfamily serine protease
MARERLGCWSITLVIVISLFVGAVAGGASSLLLVTLAPGRFLAQGSGPVIPVPAAVATAAPVSGQAPIVSEESAVVSAVRKVGPAVLTVVNTMQSQRSIFGSSAAPEARGTGIVIDPTGYVVTNFHVIEGYKSITVLMANGEKLDASVVGTDDFSDLAVLKVQGGAFTVAELGDSAALQPGQVVVAIGSALGDFRNTVTVGVVSALGRSLETDKGFNQEDLIQTDAAINSGNSGGPLINTAGQVVGINTMIAGRSTSTDVVAEGLGFAIPSNTVRYVVNELIRNGRLARPFLGVSWQSVTSRVASYYSLPVKEGVLVTRVSANSPASQAGIKTGDVIVRIDDLAVTAEMPFVNVLMRHRVGDRVKIVVNRSGNELTVEATLTESSQ